MIPFEIANQVKDAANMYDVAIGYMELKKISGQYKGKCPFHEEKTPSFTITKDKKKYKCFGCGETGDSISFLMKHDKLSYPEAIKKLADKYFIEIPEYSKKREIKKPVAPIKKDVPRLLKWFNDRGITEQTVNQFEVNFTNEWMPKAQTETDTICFSYFREKELINIKYRAANKDFKLSKDAELIFYNLDSIQDKDYVIITEGEIDCMTVSQCLNYKQPVISVPNGAAKGTQNLEYLDNCWQYFSKINQVVLFTDNDHCGIMLRDELARRIGIEKCFKVNYPPDCKDANDILLKHGKLALLDCLKNVSEFPIEGIITMTEMYEDVCDYYNHGYPAGVKVGINEFDDHLSFMAGQMTIITGIPSSGKSEFLDHLIVLAAKNQNIDCGICSFENQPSSLHVTKLMEKYIGKSFGYRHNPYSRLNLDEFNNGIIFVNEHFHFININEVDVTIDGILAKAIELVKKKGIRFLVIDPWNYVEHKLMQSQSETQYISESLSKLKGFALRYGVHIFLVAHPFKLKKENGRYEVPTLYSISGSAHFFNKTDNGITVYRNFDNNTVDIHIQKVRYSWLGKIGLVTFNYDTDLRQYSPINQFQSNLL